MLYLTLCYHNSILGSIFQLSKVDNKTESKYWCTTRSFVVLWFQKLYPKYYICLGQIWDQFLLLMFLLALQSKEKALPYFNNSINLKLRYFGAKSWNLNKHLSQEWVVFSYSVLEPFLECLVWNMTQAMSRKQSTSIRKSFKTITSLLK